MDEVLLDMTLVLAGSVLAAMIWRLLKRQAVLYRADHISRTNGAGGATAGDRRLEQRVAAYRVARVEAHLDGGQLVYPAALASEFRTHPIERRKETDTWRAVTPR